MSSSRRATPPPWWTSPTSRTPWPPPPLPREPDASSSLPPRPGAAAAAPRGCSAPAASPGTSRRRVSVTPSSPPRCRAACSTAAPGHTACTGSTSAGIPPARRRQIAGSLASHIPLAGFWRLAATRCTQRPIAVALRTSARRARWASQCRLGGPSSLWRAFPWDARTSPQPPNKFSVSPGPPPTDPASSPRNTTTVLARDGYGFVFVVSPTPHQIHADLGDRSQRASRRGSLPSFH